MTPKEKAQELVDKYKTVVIGAEDGFPCCMNNTEAKECALICVGQILNNNGIFLIGSRKYWEQVKTEIEKL